MGVSPRGGETVWYVKAVKPVPEAGGVGILPFYGKLQGLGFRRAAKPCKMHVFRFARPQNRVKYMVLALSKRKDIGKYMDLAFKPTKSCRVPPPAACLTIHVGPACSPRRAPRARPAARARRPPRAGGQGWHLGPFLAQGAPLARTLPADLAVRPRCAAAARAPGARPPA